MGISASSLLDDTKSAFIRGQAEAALQEFSPYYRKLFSVTRFSQVEDDLEQDKQKITQLLKQKDSPQEGEVLYEEGVFYFDDTRKWRERYVVVRANYCLECHESLESFVKGVPPGHKLLPTGGTVLTTEESYMAMVDKCFPDDTSVKEDFAPPLSGMPGQFPVYLRLPYRRDSYFCFKQQAKQAAFLSILSDCIRHQNQDFLKKKTCEVQAFLKAVQLYRQDKGKYQAWDMLIGSDARVLANMVMEQLLPSLEKDMLPRLKAKKTEKKRVWFATVEAAYILIQEHLFEGLSVLKEECRVTARQQEVLIHSDMDQILNSRRQLEEKIRAKVSEPAEKLCSESVQPYLGSVLDELMEPISSGFLEGRQLSESMMDQVCQDVQQGADNEELRKALADMARPNLLSCYQKIGSLQDKEQDLQQRFGFSNISGVIHGAQIDLQQLMENAAYTFEQLLQKVMQDNPENAGSAIDKAKHRVLKQYDYDSSTVRKRIFQEALVSITLPFIKKNLAPACKDDLQGLEQSVYSDHSNFIHVDNVYESILLQTLDKEVTKVVKEAASLKKYNLFTDSRDLLSQSSRSSLSSPPVSSPGSPSMALASPASPEPLPPSPLVVNGLPSSPKTEEQQEKAKGEASTDVKVMETPLGEVEEVEVPPCVAASQIPELPVLPSVAACQEAELVPPTKEEEVVVEVPPCVAECQIPELPVLSSVAAGQQAELLPPKEEEVEVPPCVAALQIPELPPTKEEEVEVPPCIAACQISELPPTKEEEVEVPPCVAACQISELPVLPSVAAREMAELLPPKVEDVVPAVTAEAGGSGAPGTQASEMQDAAAAAAETVVQEVVVSVQTEAAETAAEPETQTTEAPQEAEVTLSEPPSAVESITTAAVTDAPVPSPEPVNLPEEGAGPRPGAETQCECSEIQSAAPSGGEAPADVSPQLRGEEPEPVTVSDPNSLDVSVGSESPASDLESTDEVSTTSDVLEDEASRSPVSSDEDKPDSNQPSPAAQTAAVSSEVGVGGDIEAGASVGVETPCAEPAKEETPSGPAAQPPDSVKEIRDLVVEVIEVEELVQRYPSGVPKED